ncbi:hypothetical protein FS749_004480 [Ceratobasidium sp. UAMH 11750]|nr:hypothetical protein FS749_004480 [Ceratobasidium sp. UAMH 11750]
MNVVASPVPPKPILSSSPRFVKVNANDTRYIIQAPVMRMIHSSTATVRRSVTLSAADEADALQRQRRFNGDSTMQLFARARSVHLAHTQCPSLSFSHSHPGSHAHVLPHSHTHSTRSPHHEYSRM